MKTNKEIIIEFNVAFEKGSGEDIVKYLTEDFEWRMLGEAPIKGKDNMRKFFTEHSDVKIISVTKDHILVDGDNVSVDGEVQCIDKNGKQYDMYYCDVYELENSLINRMISYVVNKNKVPAN